MRIAFLGTLVLSGTLFACAGEQAKSESLGEGVHRIRCKTSLRACLKRAEELCPKVSYDVLGARDRRTYTGVDPAVVEYRSSEAIIECGSRAVSLFDEPDLAEQVMGSEDEEKSGEKAPAPDDTPKLACTPGLSQACTGVGGCQGGQSCLKDGSGFGPCQCAPAMDESGDAATPGDAPSETAPESTDEAPPATPAGSAPKSETAPAK